MVSLIYLLYTRVDLCFALQKLVIFSSNPGRVQFEILVNFLEYIRYNNNLALRYYARIEDAPISDVLIQDRIETVKLIVFSNSIWKDCPDTGRSIGSYIVFYQGVTFDHCTHVPGPVSQSSA